MSIIGKHIGTLRMFSMVCLSGVLALNSGQIESKAAPATAYVLAEGFALHSTIYEYSGYSNIRVETSPVDGCTDIKEVQADNSYGKIYIGMLDEDLVIYPDAETPSVYLNESAGLSFSGLNITGTCDLTNLNFASVNSADNLFNNSSFGELDLSTMNTISIKSIDGMFDSMYAGVLYTQKGGRDDIPLETMFVDDTGSKYDYLPTDMTLYGQHKVTYYNNGGEGDPVVTYVSGNTVKLPANNSFTNKNGTFSGWSTTQNGASGIFKPGDTMQVPFDVIVYAQWDGVFYEIRVTDGNSLSYPIYEKHGTGFYLDPMGMTKVLKLQISDDEEGTFRGYYTDDTYSKRVAAPDGTIEVPNTFFTEDSEIISRRTEKAYTFTLKTQKVLFDADKPIEIGVENEATDEEDVNIADFLIERIGLILDSIKVNGIKLETPDLENAKIPLGDENTLIEVIYRAGDYTSETTECITAIDWEYELDEDTQDIRLKKYIGSETDVTVYGGYEVDGTKYHTILNGPSYADLEIPNGEIVNLNSVEYLWSANNGIKLIKINKGVITEDATLLFGGLEELTGITLEDLKFSELNFDGRFSTAYMFYNDKSLTEVDVNSLDTNLVSNYNGMFAGMSKLTTLDVSKFDTINATSMNDMFRDCSSLVCLNTIGFDTSRVTSMDRMFKGLSSMKDLTLSSIEMSSVKSAEDFIVSDTSVIERLVTPTENRLTDLKIFNNAKGLDSEYNEYTKLPATSIELLFNIEAEKLIDITYFKDKGGVSKTEHKLKGANYIISSDVFDTGKQLLSWNTESDGSGTTYMPGDSYSLDEELILYAIWSSEQVTNSFTLTLVPDGGYFGSNTQPITITQKKGSTYTVSEPTRDGYTFKGWLGDTKNLKGSIFTFTEDATIMAQWTPNTYTVTLNRGTSKTSTVTVVYGQKMPDVSVPSYTGYKFGGYYTSENGSGKQYVDANGKGSDTWLELGNRTLYAKWDYITYKITINPNGGKYDGKTSSTVVENNYGSDYSIGTPTKEDSSFLGWFTSSTGGTQITSFKEVTGNITVYAHWSELASFTGVTVSSSGKVILLSDSGKLYNVSVSGDKIVKSSMSTSDKMKQVKFHGDILEVLTDGNTLKSSSTSAGSSFGTAYLTNVSDNSKLYSGKLALSKNGKLIGTDASKFDSYKQYEVVDYAADNNSVAIFNVKIADLEHYLYVR